MWKKKIGKPSIECTRVQPTKHRPGSKGTYIVQLSSNNTLRLKVRNGAYLIISYGEASVLACLSVEDKLDDEIIRMDQILLKAIGLETIRQDSEKSDLIYDPDGDGDLLGPIVIQRSDFRGSMWKTKLDKPFIECTRVRRTVHRPGSRGTYTVRLSPANQQRLRVRNGAYLIVSYGEATMLACLSVSEDLNDNETILMGQTLRHGIGLKGFLEVSQKNDLIYDPDGNGSLSYPIKIQRSDFRGPRRKANLDKPSIECTRVQPTKHRPGSKGTYIVRLSPDNTRRLKVKDGAYLNISYGEASALACLSVNKDLDDETILMDQTLRHAICLKGFMQEAEKKNELNYNPDGEGDLTHPIIVQGSNFRGPSIVAKLFKKQYLICIVHHATPRDMETPLARLTTEAMGVLGIQRGDKVLLISEKKTPKSLRCLPLNPDTKLPFKSMNSFTPPCPESAYEELHLPWITIDMQTRLDLGVNPWFPVIVGRAPRHILAYELGELASAIAIAAMGGAFVFPANISFLGKFAEWLPTGIIALGIITVGIVTLFKIRSKI